MSRNIANLGSNFTRFAISTYLRLGKVLLMFILVVFMSLVIQDSLEARCSFLLTVKVSGCFEQMPSRLRWEQREVVSGGCLETESPCKHKQALGHKCVSFFFLFKGNVKNYCIFNVYGKTGY